MVKCHRCYGWFLATVEDDGWLWKPIPPTVKPKKEPNPSQMRMFDE